MQRAYTLPKTYNRNHTLQTTLHFHARPFSTWSLIPTLIDSPSLGLFCHWTRRATAACHEVFQSQAWLLD